MAFSVTHLSAGSIIPAAAEASCPLRRAAPAQRGQPVPSAWGREPGSSPGHSAHPVPHFIWGKKPPVRDPSLLFLHCLTSRHGDPSLPLAVSPAVSPHAAPAAAWGAGTSQPSACGDQRELHHTAHVPCAYSFTLAELAFPATPCHWQLSHCADGVCHSPLMSPAVPSPAGLPCPCPSGCLWSWWRFLAPLPCPSLPGRTAPGAGVSPLSPSSCCQPLLCSAPREERGAGGRLAETQTDLILLC